MFLDYVPLLLINMAAGLVILAHFVHAGLDATDRGRWAPAFGIAGVIALAGGFYMIWTWPLPGSYNAAFGEMSVLLGGLFLGAAWATAKGWDLLPVTLYAFLAGLMAVVLGVRIWNLGLTRTPALTGIGFLLTGSGGLFALPAYCFRTVKGLRVVGALVLVAAAAIWTLIAGAGYWDHLASFAKWVPATMR